MENNLELVYWSDEGGISLPIDDWQWEIIIQVLGLNLSPDKKTLNCSTKETVLKRLKMPL